MSTSNFYTQANFDLYATNFADEETGFFDQYLYEETKDKIEMLNQTLRFYQLKLKSGYYEGTQIYVDQGEDYCDEYYLSSKYFEFREYGVNRYILRRMIAAEQKRINNKLLPLFKEYGFNKYEIAAQFSNGETWYKKAD